MVLKDQFLFLLIFRPFSIAYVSTSLYGGYGDQILCLCVHPDCFSIPRERWLSCILQFRLDNRIKFVLQFYFHLKVILLKKRLVGGMGKN